MRFTLVIQPGPEFLLLEASGPMDLGDLCGMFDLAARICQMNGHRRVLLNLLETQVDLSFTEHLRLGAHAAASLASVARAASVVSPQARRGTSEKAAQNHGLPFRTFTDLAAALAWIGPAADSGPAELPAKG